jgi:cytochrome c-type biogenesis protein CcmH
MMLWIAFAFLLAATLAALIYPLWRAPSASPSRAAYDLAVYRGQLAEVEIDVGRGLVPPEQADAVRLEIHRRMLAAGSDGPAPTDDLPTRMTAAIVIALMLPLGAGLLYVSMGNPQLPDKPYADRVQHDPAVILADAADKMAAQLAAKPNAAGYVRLAQLYSLQRDHESAADAFERAIRLGADNASTWAGLGEALALASGGVTPKALGAFARALELDAREPRARFYAGMAEAQIGDFKRAVAIWRDLEKDSTADAPWLPVLRRKIAAVAKFGRFDPASVPPAPASAEALKAAVAAMNKAM